ncbi:DMBT1 protein, partial [Ramphastos sulfuratus]|nr:DMBT1 protein [Ramphastos sulfuratus]
ALVCLPSSMRAALDRRYLELQGYSVWNVSLPHAGCSPTVTAAEVVFSIPYNGCGTRREV